MARGCQGELLAQGNEARQLVHGLAGEQHHPAGNPAQKLVARPNCPGKLRSGAWLRYRGHLENFSANLLSGAVNAWTGAVGVTTNVRTGAAALPIAEVARDYRAHGLRWVIVGDSNYGEGSSREHAALSPRLLSGAAVIARSFARIHESNLKKQGLLALTFADPQDYERIRQGDRISLTGLAALLPGVPVACEVLHADGSRDAFLLRHSYSTTQTQWFRTGSALNAARRVAEVTAHANKL